MVCRLCLTESDDGLEIFKEEKIHQYIIKFLQLELTPEDPVSKVICPLCWRQLEDFHNFCLRVSEAQKTLLTVHKELKKEAHFVDDIPFEAVNTDTDLLKKEDLGANASDETNGAFLCLNENAIKIELHDEEIFEASVITPAETNDIPSTRRITRALKLKRQSSPKKEVHPDIEVKRKCGRPKKEKVENKLAPEKEDNVDREEKHIFLSLGASAERKRGRPRKGEEKEKVGKVRSEKTNKILDTIKEFDDIIQKNMNLNCNICAESLIDFSALKRHFRDVHKRKGYAVCCNKRLYKRPLVVDHINTHINPEHFKCTHCGKVMADRMCLRNHVLLKHQKEDDKLFQCSYCPKKYAKQYLLTHHEVKHIPQEECPFTCTECGRGFPTNAFLQQHFKQVHSTVYDKMCEICAKLIRGKAAFEVHMEEHEGIVRPQVQCEICGSWLKNKNSLRNHMNKHDGKSHTCHVCGKIATTKSTLQSHFKYVHQAVRQFSCTYCGKSFKKDVILREHLTIHTGEVLYTCPHCPQTFNSKANMHSHRKKRHRKEWEANRRFNKVTVNENN